MRWLAVIESNIALLGTIRSVRQAIDRHVYRDAADPSLIRKLARLRSEDETWCVLAVRTRSGRIRDALELFSPKLAGLIQVGDTMQFGIRYGRQVEFEYEVNTGSSIDAVAMSRSLAESLAGSQLEGSPLLAAPDIATTRSAVRGVVKVSRARYGAWLAEVMARGSAKIAPCPPRR